MVNLRSDEPLAGAATEAIRTGDVETLKRLLRENPGLATVRIGPRTLLHIATDWPRHFPNGPATVAALIAAGADVNAPSTGKHAETPLHWAASSDDVAVLDTLLEGGANIEAPGSVIGGGTPLADAVAFGQWRAARRLAVYRDYGRARLQLLQFCQRRLSQRQRRPSRRDPQRAASTE
jgi:ankyrin repeat protein